MERDESYSSMVIPVQQSKLPCSPASRKKRSLSLSLQNESGILPQWEQEFSPFKIKSTIHSRIPSTIRVQFSNANSN